MATSNDQNSEQGDPLARRLGARVHAARKQASLSRKELGRRAAVSERYLVQLEAGTANASIGLVARLAEVLRITISELLAEQPRSGRTRVDPQLAALLASLTPREQAEALELLRQHAKRRRRRTKGIALLGLRGAGKSTLGAALADRLQLPFLSVTRTIEELAGMSATELFNLGGADSYRRLEVEAVERIASEPGQAVVEAAGGIVANPPALDAIMARYATVWLKASPEEHLERVRLQGDLRPMRDNPQALENIRALLKQREPDYARAEHTVETTGLAPEQALEFLMALARRSLDKSVSGS